MRSIVLLFFFPAYCFSQIYNIESVLYSEGNRIQIKTSDSSINQILESKFLIDFWFINCPPCIEAMDYMNHMIKVNNLDSKKFIFINPIDSPEAIKTFIEKRGYKMVFLTGKLDSIRLFFNVSFYPSTFIVNNDFIRGIKQIDLRLYKFTDIYHFLSSKGDNALKEYKPIIRYIMIKNNDSIVAPSIVFQPLDNDYFRLMLLSKSPKEIINQFFNLFKSDDLLIFGENFSNLQSLNFSIEYRNNEKYKLEIIDKIAHYFDYNIEILSDSIELYEINLDTTKLLYSNLKSIKFINLNENRYQVDGCGILELPFFLNRISKRNKVSNYFNSMDITMNKKISFVFNENNPSSMSEYGIELIKIKKKVNIIKIFEKL